MLRGTTPSVTMTLPSGTSLSGASAAFMTFGQNGKEVFSVVQSSLTVSSNTVSCTLTQAQTLMLEHGKDTEIQLRWKNNGVAYGTNIVRVSTDMILKDGEI